MRTLSILDVAGYGPGGSAAEAVRTTVRLARQAEEWGYRRFWVGEHHATPGTASSAPAVLLAAVGAATRAIRIGSGGVMLPNHAPLVVAEQFATLAALHPGRVDLGIGRAPGTDPATARALRAGSAAADFPEQLAELTRFLDGSGPVPVEPRPEPALPLWLLGSSATAAELAGRRGLPFAFAHHLGGSGTVEALERYRASCRPGVAPYAVVSVTAIAHEEPGQARRLARAAALGLLRLRRGERRATAAEQDQVADWLSRMVLGTPEQVAEGLDRLRKRTGADELMITSPLPDPEPRLRSFELIARACDLRS